MNQVIIPFMKKMARFLLLCLIIVMIPVQGIAAAAKSCGTVAGSQSHSSDSLESVHEAIPQVLAHEHKSSAEAVKNDNSSCPDCGDCAECCVGCAMMMACCQKITPEPFSEKIGLLFPSYFDHINDGLLRPPRI